MAKSFKHVIPTKGMGQANFSQCWYASYKMLYHYLKRNPSEIDEKLKGVIDIADCKENGLADTDYKKTCQALGLKGWTGHPFNAKAGFFDVGLSDGTEAFLKELELGPLWVSWIAESRPGKRRAYHIIVATGYDDSTSRIIYNNPFPGPENAFETTMKANLLTAYITAASCSIQAWRYTLGGE